MVKVALGHEPVSTRGRELYERELRAQMETEENIGKIIIIVV